ncbi:MAG: HEAT repeat domain-containing protein [Ferruginibacter sp.]
MDIQNKQLVKTIVYFSDGDTYVRKAAYLTIGKIYNNNALFQDDILSMLVTLLKDEDCKIRQTAVNAAGEIGIKKFEPVESIFDKGLFDEHHSVRNAVIGSVKKMGNKNPAPILNWARKYLHHPDKEIRREICHGIELRGRTHPADILPLLKELQWDKTARVRNTLVHVLGQISYKKNCLLTVIDHLNNWDNKEVINKAIKEIIDVHQRYENFAAMTQQQAIGFINRHLKTPLPFSNNKP